MKCWLISTSSEGSSRAGPCSGHQRALQQASMSRFAAKWVVGLNAPSNSTLLTPQSHTARSFGITNAELSHAMDSSRKRKATNATPTTDNSATKKIKLVVRVPSPSVYAILQHETRRCGACDCKTQRHICFWLWWLVVGWCCEGRDKVRAGSRQSIGGGIGLWTNLTHGTSVILR